MQGPRGSHPPPLRPHSGGPSSETNGHGSKPMGSHFGVGAPPILEPILVMGMFTGGYRVLTHSHITNLRSLVHPEIDTKLHPGITPIGKLTHCSLGLAVTIQSCTSRVTCGTKMEVTLKGMPWVLCKKPGQFLLWASLRVCKTASTHASHSKALHQHGLWAHFQKGVAAQLPQRRHAWNRGPCPKSGTSLGSGVQCPASSAHPFLAFWTGFLTLGSSPFCFSDVPLFQKATFSAKPYVPPGLARTAWASLHRGLEFEAGQLQVQIPASSADCTKLVSIETTLVSDLENGYIKGK